MQVKPTIHGPDHLPGGPDPIPGRSFFLAVARDFQLTGGTVPEQDPSQTVTKNVPTDVAWRHFTTNDAARFSWADTSDRHKINILLPGTYYFECSFQTPRQAAGSLAYRSQLRIRPYNVAGPSGTEIALAAGGYTWGYDSSMNSTAVGRNLSPWCWGRYSSAGIPDYTTLEWIYYDGDATLTLDTNTPTYLWGWHDPAIQFPDGTF